MFWIPAFAGMTGVRRDGFGKVLWTLTGILTGRGVEAGPRSDEHHRVSAPCYMLLSRMNAVQRQGLLNHDPD